MKLYINGRFLTQKVTGVQRVGIEILRELDKIVNPGEIIVLSPPDIINDIKLNNIEIITIGKKSNNFWTQVTLPLYAMKNKVDILTLAGMCPILKPGYFMAHDVTFLRFPESFSKSFRISYKLDYMLTLNRCKKVFTVSEFSKRELIDTVKAKKDKVIVTYNGTGTNLQDLSNQVVDITKWGIEAGEYYLSVSSQNLHKNQEFIFKCAEKFPERKFVIVGSNQIKSFAAVEQTNLSNVIFTGYVSDEELSSLYKQAKGFIFPSLYEGFGIPPLEAISMGIKRVAVSDIPVFREIYQKGVYYFDPYNIDKFDMNEFDTTVISEVDREYYMNLYTYEKVARKIMKVVKENAD